MNTDHVRALVLGDLVDNMSSVGPSADMFYVDTSWALELIQAVNEPEPKPQYEKVGWVSVQQRNFIPDDYDLPPGRFDVYRQTRQGR